MLTSGSELNRIIDILKVQGRVSNREQSELNTIEVS